MSRKGKKRQARKPGQLRWAFPPGIPTQDFLKGCELDDDWGLGSAIDAFIYWLNEDRFQIWEAVVCQEAGMALTPRQASLLDDLLNFNDEDDDDQILYINDSARPSEPWHVILNRIVPHLLLDPFRTRDIPNDTQIEGWHRIMGALRTHGQGLLLPEGAASVDDVVPAELQHKLWLQYCFTALSGLGQDECLTLENPDQQDRIDEFVGYLKKHKQSVAYFNLTLESLLTRVLLPERDQPIFLKLMQEKLGLHSIQERIADRL